MKLGRTPSQTVGPYLAIGLDWDEGPFVVDEHVPGAITVEGRVLDGAGEPVIDALLETWQADPDGRFERDGGFRGFARCATDDQGRFRIVTVKPGRVPGPDDTTQAPHLSVAVFARGLLSHLFTRIYFSDETEANDADPILSLIKPVRARETLIAKHAEGGYRLDIHLQGELETVFFDV